MTIMNQEIRRTLQNLLPGSRYATRVRAVNEFGIYSPWSEALEFIADSSVSATYDLVAPPAPTVQPQINALQIIMNYTAENDGITTYKLEHSTNNVNFSTIAVTQIPLYLHQVAPGVTHYYRFSVVDVYGQVSPVSPSNSGQSLSGISHKPYSTVVVAASNSIADGADNADYVCDGVDDHIQIQAAIDYVSSASGGKVLLLEGEYFVGGPITIDHYGVQVEGMGRENTYVSANYEPVFNDKPIFRIFGSDCGVHNLSLYNPNGSLIGGDKTGQTTDGNGFPHGGSAPYALSVTGCNLYGNYDQNLILAALDFDGSSLTGLQLHNNHIQGTPFFLSGSLRFNCHISDNQIETYQGAIYTRTSEPGGNYPVYAVISNNTYNASGSGVSSHPGGFVCVPSPFYAGHLIITGNIISYLDQGAAISAHGLSDSVITNNVFSQNREGAIKVTQAYKNSIVGNSFENNDGSHTIDFGNTSQHNVISSNVIRNDEGIRLRQGSRSNTVSGNVFQNNSGNSPDILCEGSRSIIVANRLDVPNIGISITSSASNNLVKGNLISKTFDQAIIVDGDHNTVDGNKIIDRASAFGSNKIGIHVRGDFSSILNNIITNTNDKGSSGTFTPYDYGILVTSSASNTLVNGNDLASATVSNFSDSGSNTSTGAGNRINWVWVSSLGGGGGTVKAYVWDDINDEYIEDTDLAIFVGPDDPATATGGRDEPFDLWFSEGSGGGTGDLNYVHDQASSSTTWTIAHNLDKFVSVTTIDSTDRVIIGLVTYDSVNQVTVTFNVATSGKAYCN